MAKTVEKKIVIPRALLKELRGAATFSEIGRRMVRLGYRCGDAALMIECCSRLLGRAPTRMTVAYMLKPGVYTERRVEMRRESSRKWRAKPENLERKRRLNRESSRKWRTNNLERAREINRISSRKWITTPEGREKNRKKSRLWRENNIECARNASRKWHSIPKNRERRRRWRSKPETRKQLCQASLAWARANPGKAHAKRTLRRARKRAAVPPWSETEAIKLFYEACPKGMHLDHIIPLCHPQLDGLHVLGNLQYLPASENWAKGNRLDLTPRQIAKAIADGLAVPKGARLVKWKGHVWKRSAPPRSKTP